MRVKSLALSLSKETRVLNCLSTISNSLPEISHCYNISRMIETRKVIKRNKDGSRTQKITTRGGFKFGTSNDLEIAEYTFFQTFFSERFLMQKIFSLCAREIIL